MDAEERERWLRSWGLEPMQPQKPARTVLVCCTCGARWELVGPGEYACSSGECATDGRPHDEFVEEREEDGTR